MVLGLGFLVLFVGGGARFVIGLTLRPLVEEFGWDRASLGGAVAVFQVVSAVAMFAAGRLADWASPRGVIAGGVALSGFGIGLMSLVAAPWHAVVLYGVVFALGSGAASLIPVGVMVTRAFPGAAGLANGVAISGMSLGQLVVIALSAALLVQIGWRSVFVWIGAAHLVVVALLLLAPVQAQGAGASPARPATGMRMGQAARTRQFWLLMLIYSICGFDDFFVSTHVVAFAQDRGMDAFLAGNLLALMGLTGLVGVLAASAWADRVGPVRGTALAFGARIVVFAWIAIDQSPVSVAVFALVFGATFLVTAPLTVLFVRESFGTAHLGALTGIITMVHQIWGGVGAYVGARVFDATGSYDRGFALMLALTAVALVATLRLQRPSRPAT